MVKTNKNRIGKVIIASTVIFFVLFVVLRDLVLANAVEDGSLPFTNLMLSLGADPKSWDEGEPVLCWAATDHNTEIVQALLSRGANIDQEGESGDTPLICAINENDFETVKYLLSRGASLSAKNSHGQTAASLASRAKDVRIRRLVKS